MKKNIMIFICGMLSMMAITVGAVTILTANDVFYIKDGNSTTTVQNVLDELNIKANAGNANSTQILKDITALVNGTLITGTMENNTGWNSTPTESGKVYIPEGYHDGNGYVDTSSVYQAGIQSVPNDPASALDISGSLTGSANPHSGYFSKTYMHGSFRQIDSTTFCATENMKVLVTINWSVGGNGTSTSAHYGIFYYNNTEYQRLYYGRSSLTFTMNLSKDAPIRLYAYTVRSNEYYINMSMTMDKVLVR